MNEKIKIKADKDSSLFPQYAAFSFEELNELSLLTINLKLDLDNTEELLKNLFKYLDSYRTFDSKGNVTNERTMRERLMYIKDSKLGMQIFLANTRYLDFTKKLIDNKEFMSETKREIYNVLLKTLQSLLETNKLYVETHIKLEKEKKITKR